MTQDEFDRNDDPETPGGFFDVTLEWVLGTEADEERHLVDGTSPAPLLWKGDAQARNVRKQNKTPNKPTK